MAHPVQTYTFEEIQEIQKEQKHPYFSLINVDGSKIVPFNQHGTDPAGKLAEIKTALKNPAITDGLYIIRAKSTLNRNGATIDYYLIKGNPETVDISEHLADDNNEKFEPNVTSYSNVLDLRVENERLKMENKALKESNEEMAERLEELEKEFEEMADQEESKLLSEQPNNLENIQKFINSTLQIVTPMMDKHFELRERKMRIEEEKFRQQPQPQLQQQRPEEVYQMDAIRHTDKQIQNWINQYQDEPEKYNKFAEVYNQSENMNHFFQIMEEVCTDDEFLSLQNAINGKS